MHFNALQISEILLHVKKTYKHSCQVSCLKVSFGLPCMQLSITVQYLVAFIFTAGYMTCLVKKQTPVKTLRARNKDYFQEVPSLSC